VVKNKKKLYAKIAWKKWKDRINLEERKLELRKIKRLGAD
jgi:hypothetical protein